MCEISNNGEIKYDIRVTIPVAQFMTQNGAITAVATPNYANDGNMDISRAPHLGSNSSKNIDISRAP